MEKWIIGKSERVKTAWRDSHRPFGTRYTSNTLPTVKTVSLFAVIGATSRDLASKSNRVPEGRDQVKSTTTTTY